MEDWFRWIVGGLIVLYSAITGWVVTQLFKNFSAHASLNTRLAVLEARPVIDPVVYAETIAKLSLQVAQLTREISGLADEIHMLRKERMEA